MKLRPRVHLLSFALVAILASAPALAEDQGERRKKPASGDEASEAKQYPRTVVTEAGTLVIENASQEIGEIISQDPANGYVAYTGTEGGVLYKRFTKEGIEQIREAYGDEAAEMVEQANDGTGKRQFDKAVNLEADLVQSGVDPDEAKEVSRSFLKEPKAVDERRAREKAIVDAFDLPPGLLDRGWSAKDLADLAADTQQLGIENPRKEITPEFFDDWQRARRKGREEAKSFVKKWGEERQGERRGQAKVRDKEQGDSRRIDPADGRGGDRQKITGSGGGGSGSGAGGGGTGAGSGTGSGSGRVGAAAPGRGSLPAGGGPNSPSPTGGGSSPDGGTGPQPGGASGGSPGPGGGGGGSSGDARERPRVGHAEVSDSTPILGDSYTYRFKTYDNQGRQTSSGTTTCGNGRCVDSFDGGGTNEYPDENGAPPEDGTHDLYGAAEGDDSDDTDDAGRVAPPGTNSSPGKPSQADIDSAHSEGGQQSDRINVNPELGNKGGGKTVVLDRNEDRINKRPELGSNKGGRPSTPTVPKQEQRINRNPDLGGANPGSPGKTGPRQPPRTRESKDTERSRTTSKRETVGKKSEKKSTKRKTTTQGKREQKKARKERTRDKRRIKAGEAKP